MSTQDPPLLDDLVQSNMVEAPTVIASTDRAGVQVHASAFPFPEATTGITPARRSLSIPSSNKSVGIAPPKDNTATPGDA